MVGAWALIHAVVGQSGLTQSGASLQFASNTDRLLHATNAMWPRKSNFNKPRASNFVGLRGNSSN